MRAVTVVALTCSGSKKNAKQDLGVMLYLTLVQVSRTDLVTK